MNINIKVISLSGVLIVVALLFWNLDYIPSDFEGDGNIHAYISLNLVKNRELAYSLPGPDSIPHYYPYLYPLWQIFLAFLFKILGVSKYVVSLGTLFIFLLTVLVFYLFLKELLPEIGEIALFLFVYSLWLLPYWQYGMGPFTIMPMLSILILFCYYKMLTRKNVGYYMFLLSLSLSLAIFNGYWHILIWYPILFISSLMSRNFKVAPHPNPLPLWGRGEGEGANSFNRRLMKGILYSFILSFFIYFCVVYIAAKFIYRCDVLTYFRGIWTVIEARIETDGAVGKSIWWHNFTWICRELFYKSYGEYNEGFNIYTILGYSWLSPVVSILFLTGLVYSWIKRDILSTTLNIWFFFTIIVYVFLIKPVSRYLIMISPCIYLFSGMGLYLIYNLIKERGVFWYNSLFILILLYTSVNFNLGYTSYFKNNFNMKEYFGMKEASDYIVKDSKDVKKNVKVQYQFGEREFNFYTKEMFINSSSHWGGFREEFIKSKEDMFYFIFPAPSVNVYGRESQAIEYKRCFPNDIPVWVIYFNDGRECKYIYKRDNR